MEKFTETTDYYHQYRPSYPAEIIDILIRDCHLTQEKMIADVGSGTGILTKLFLDHGNKVFGIEPNKAMRQIGEAHLLGYKNFTSVDGSAEKTTLNNQSVDFVTVGTAFHWFDAVRSKLEFQRILRAPKWVVLIWQVRDMSKPLMQEWEDLIIQFGRDYKNSRAQQFDQTIGDFFAGDWKQHTLDYQQVFDWEAFKGRLFSTSYSLRPGDDKFQDMLDKLRHIFEQYQQNGEVCFDYKTKMYYGLI